MNCAPNPFKDIKQKYTSYHPNLTPILTYNIYIIAATYVYSIEYKLAIWNFRQIDLFVVFVASAWLDSPTKKKHFYFGKSTEMRSKKDWTLNVFELSTLKIFMRPRWKVVKVGLKSSLIEHKIIYGHDLEGREKDFYEYNSD